jgi:hypothetical protein
MLSELRERSLVYEFDWYDIYPPSAMDLQAAFDRR